MTTWGRFSSRFWLRLSLRRCALLLGLTTCCICLFWFSSSADKLQDDLVSLESYQSDPSVDDTSYGDSQFKEFDLNSLRNDLHTQVNELLKIRASVLRELQQIEQNRSKKRRQQAQLNNDLQTLESRFTKRNSDLEQIELYLQQALVAKQKDKDKPEVFAWAPLKLIPSGNPIIVKNDFTNLQCEMSSCFDYSKCSTYSQFKMYVYKHTEDDLITEDGPESMYNSMIYQQLQANVHSIQNPDQACLYVIFIPRHFKKLSSLNDFMKFIVSHSHWKGDGGNHLILNADERDLKTLGLNFSKAIIAQSQFSVKSFSRDYDLVIPTLLHPVNSSWTDRDHPPALTPVRRKYFLTYLGHIPANKPTFSSIISQSLSTLQARPSIVPHNEFLFDFKCDDKTRPICDNQTIILLDSTFTILFPEQFNFISGYDGNFRIHSEQFSSKLLNALRAGTIPVIVGGDKIRLPFDEAIDWKRAVFRIPIARISELYFILKTFTDSDISSMRSFGAQLFNNYFATTDKMLNSIISYFRGERLQIPAPPIKDEATEHHYNTGKYSSGEFNSSNVHLRNKIYADDEEMLGPLEAPFESPRFMRNFSLLTDSYRNWNYPNYSPHSNFPSLPNDPILPTDAQFMGSSFGFRPINNGSGGSGKEFSQSIGGNVAREQFTIVVLTYERESILLAMLAKLKDLPYLNKVIVVWNAPTPPSEDIIWPDIGVDIVVVKVQKNSLNNRFLPFDEIKTDAIFSLDDDSNFRNDEIILAFRVWRENRDRIVGFPARGHTWNGERWNYSSNYTCEFSMVLTGGAFIHKYYYYFYSKLMQQEIRQKVDELMNCEDIAMNFLVAHLSRQPPIKVTARWTFRCPTCPNNLSSTNSHYLERSECINYFSKIYGYTPLLYTQYRADSVLFKTRVGQGHQKCFRYI